jgi:hypothetical protein
MKQIPSSTRTATNSRKELYNKMYPTEEKPALIMIKPTKLTKAFLAVSSCLTSDYLGYKLAEEDHT